MSSQYTLKMDSEKAKEMPMVDLAFAILRAANTPFYYRDLMAEIAKVKQLGEGEMMEVIAQLYTEINIDGRFACVGTNLWGLKRWYPVEKIDDAVGNAKRPRIINDEDDDDSFEEEDDFKPTDEEDSYDALGSKPKRNIFFDDEDADSAEEETDDEDEDDELLEEEIEEDELEDDPLVLIDDEKEEIEENEENDNDDDDLEDDEDFEDE